MFAKLSSVFLDILSSAHAQKIISKNGHVASGVAKIGENDLLEATAPEVIATRYLHMSMLYLESILLLTCFLSQLSKSP